MKESEELFKRMVRDVLAPALRDLGFKGSGNRYALPSADYWAQLGIQTWHQWDDNVHFTVNLSVVSKSDWREFQRTPEWKGQLPERPSANASYSKEIRSQRLGGLIPGSGGDKWWTVEASSDPPEIAAAVAADVREYALPWLRARMGSAS